MFWENLTKFREGESPLYTNPKPRTDLSMVGKYRGICRKTCGVFRDVFRGTFHGTFRGILRIIIHYFILLPKLIPCVMNPYVSTLQRVSQEMTDADMTDADSSS